MSAKVIVGKWVLKRIDKYCSHCRWKEQECELKLADEVDKYFKSKSTENEIEDDFIRCFDKLKPTKESNSPNSSCQS